jgi:CheY-like chemotaxis protein
MRHLKGRPGLRGIALSGFGMEEDRWRSRDAGFAQHLTKPIDFRDLEGAIRQVTS